MRWCKFPISERLGKKLLEVAHHVTSLWYVVGFLQMCGVSWRRIHLKISHQDQRCRKVHKRPPCQRKTSEDAIDLEETTQPRGVSLQKVWCRSTEGPWPEGNGKSSGTLATRAEAWHGIAIIRIITIMLGEKKISFNFCCSMHFTIASLLTKWFHWTGVKQVAEFISMS